MYKQDPDEAEQPCLMVAIQNGYPLTLKPSPEFWGKLAPSLTANPRDLDDVEDAVKNVFCRAIQSVIDNNNNQDITLALRKNLNIPLHELKRIICPPKDGDQPAKTPNLTSTVITSAVSNLHGNFLNRMSKAIEKLNKHGAQLSKAVLALQEQITALQAQAPPPLLAYQGSQTVRYIQIYP